MFPMCLLFSAMFVIESLIPPAAAAYLCTLYGDFSF